MKTRSLLLKRALWLERLTIVWNVAEAVIAVGAGLLAGSIALVGFGLDSVIETIAAAALYRRLRAERNGASEEEAEAHERKALWIVGITFFLLGGYVAFEAVSTLWMSEPPESSPVGIILASVSLVVMPVLAIAKHRTGKALDSRAGFSPDFADTSKRADHVAGGVSWRAEGSFQTSTSAKRYGCRPSLG